MATSATIPSLQGQAARLGPAWLCACRPIGAVPVLPRVRERTLSYPEETTAIVPVPSITCFCTVEVVGSGKCRTGLLVFKVPVPLVSLLSNSN